MREQELLTLIHFWRYGDIHKEFTLAVLLLGVVPFLAGMSVYALSNAPPDIQNRKEFTTCSIKPSEFPANAELEFYGCPTVRVYINNWDSLTPVEQSSITQLLTSKGFVENETGTEPTINK